MTYSKFLAWFSKILVCQMYSVTDKLDSAWVHLYFNRITIQILNRTHSTQKP